MGETRENDGYEEELVDYDDEEANAPASVAAKVNGETVKKWVRVALVCCCFRFFDFALYVACLLYQIV